MDFLFEAIKGVKAEMQAMETLPRQLRRLPKVLGLLLREVAALFTLIPYAVSTMALYRSLPGPKADPASARLGVTVERDVQYGRGERCVLDVYRPAQAAAAATPPASSSGGSSNSPAPGPPPGGLRPVVVFVHGGVWASGEKWHYAPFATRIAQEGFVVVVPTYALYPKALCPQMVREVSDSLTWALDHAASLGGDASAVTLVGHSAGAHLTAMALLARAAAAAAAAGETGAGTAGTGAAGASGGTGAGSVGTAGGASGGTGAGTVGTAAGASGRNGGFAAPAPGAPDQRGASEAGTAAPGPGGRGRGEGRAAAPASSVVGDWSSDAAPGRAGATETGAYLHGAGTSFGDAAASLAAVASGGFGGGANGGANGGVYGGANGVVEGGGGGGGIEGGGRVTLPGSLARLAVGVGVTDGRMPAACINMAGVYDIARHYEFESQRGVHELSMMKRAMGGPAGFAAMSPSVLLRGGAGAAQHAAAAETNDARHLPRHFTGVFELSGEAIPARARLHAAPSSSSSPYPSAATGNGDRSAGNGNGYGGGADGGEAGGEDEDARVLSRLALLLPPTFCMSSCADHMVPWHEGAEFVDALHGVGAPACHLIYNHTLHGDFVMSWKPMSAAAVAAARGGAPDEAGASAGGDPVDGAPALQDFARDFLKLTRGAVGSGAALGGGVGGSRPAQAPFSLQPAALRAVRDAGPRTATSAGAMRAATGGQTPLAPPVEQPQRTHQTWRGGARGGGGVAPGLTAPRARELPPRCRAVAAVRTRATGAASAARLRCVTGG
ncbi:hypothetical protein FOA52_015692 [Chlamydomonas sp. UWO 241]|nr:hypothetical protein FOA52_015692 [Chlamydomonas sp. UWO 241]